MSNDATTNYTHLISDERWGETCLVDDVETFVSAMEESMFPAYDVRQAYLEACDAYTKNGEEIPDDVTEANIVEGWRDELRSALQDVEPVTLADGRTGYMTASEKVYVETANGCASYEGKWPDLKPEAA